MKTIDDKTMKRLEELRHEIRDTLEEMEHCSSFNMGRVSELGATLDRLKEEQAELLDPGPKPRGAPVPSVMTRQERIGMVRANMEATRSRYMCGDSGLTPKEFKAIMKDGRRCISEIRKRPKEDFA